MTAATLSHPPGTNLVSDPSALDDTAVGIALPAGSRRRVLVRLLALVGGCTVAFWPAWRPLLANLGSDTPIAYSATAPIIAAALVGVAIRTSPAATPRLARRQADLVMAALVVGAAVTTALWLPGRFGFLSNELRAELIALPLVALAGCLLLFGSRLAFHVRPAIYVLALASPLGYSWLLDATTGLAWRITWVPTALTARALGISATNLSGTGLLDVGEGQLLAVSAVCSGIASVAGWVIVATAFTSLCDGKANRKLLFVGTGLVAVLAANIIRIIVLVATARTWSLELAYGSVHPYAGFVALAAVVAVMMLIAPRFGLRRRATSAPSAIDRVAVVSPPRVRREMLAWAAVVAVLFVVTAQTWRFDQLGGQNGRPNVAAASLLTSQATTEGSSALAAWRIHELPDVPWAEQFFGPGAEWRRYLATSRNAISFVGDSSAASAGAPAVVTITVDVTTVDDVTHLDRFSLAACYGFHGYEIERSSVSTALPDRSAERIVFRDDDTSVSTSVLSFRQRTFDGRIERVVVSARVAAGAESTGNDAVLDMARAIASASASTGTP